MLHVLDTTVLIDYLRGRPAVERVEALHDRGDVPATTAINVEEIVRGLRETERDATRHLFAGLIVLPIDAYAGWQAGDWRPAASRCGRPTASWQPRRWKPALPW